MTAGQNEIRVNGFASYETWLVGLWIDQEQGSQEFWQVEAQTALDNTPDRDEARVTLADQLREMHETPVERLGLTGMYADLMEASLGRVDWQDLAEHILGDVEQG